MSGDQLFVYATLAGCLVLFVGSWVRYDVVAVIALLAVTLRGIVSPGEAFAGFGHPAVVTVAAVLILSRGLRNSGLVDLIAALLLRLGNRLTVQRSGLTSLVAACSAFMNNIGALAVLMPVAIQMSRKAGRSPSMLLMPMAFGSLLGGLVTLIGTPPNIIVATFRGRTGEPFGMFDFAPVGGTVAVVGVLFIVIFGWRLIPHRQPAVASQDLFKVEDYITELRVGTGCKLANAYLRNLEELVDPGVVVVGLIRGERCESIPSQYERLRIGDVLLVEADPETIEKLVESAGLELVGNSELHPDAIKSKDVRIAEMIVSTESSLIGRQAGQTNLRWGLGINMLAVARQGRSVHTRLTEVRFQPGDILLLQGAEASLGRAVSELGLMPLAERGLRLGQPRRLFLSAMLFIAAIAATAIGLVPIHIGFVAAVVLMIIMGQVSVHEIYQSIDWPVIVLLGAMIPVGQAMEITGGSRQIAEVLLTATQSSEAWVALSVVLVVTMFLSDLMNNAATAVLMLPIAMRVAEGLGASPDPFLMAVAIGASCAFITPVGHQSNTLVMKPGGYRFGDYWRLGLPLEVVIVLVAVPMLMLIWPLFPPK